MSQGVKLLLSVGWFFFSLPFVVWVFGKYVVIEEDLLPFIALEIVNLLLIFAVIGGVI